MPAIRSLMAPNAKGKLQARTMSVPAAIKRTAGVKPNLFWDKTAYALGVTDTRGAGQGKRTAAENAAFGQPIWHCWARTTRRLRHYGPSARPGCRSGSPTFRMLTLVDQNVVFRLGDGPFLHEPARRQALLAGGEGAIDVPHLGSRGARRAAAPDDQGGDGRANRRGVAGLVQRHRLRIPRQDAGRQRARLGGRRLRLRHRPERAAGERFGNVLRIGDDTVAFWARGRRGGGVRCARWRGHSAAEARGELRARVQAVRGGRRSRRGTRSRRAALRPRPRPQCRAPLGALLASGHLRDFADAVTGSGTNAPSRRRPSPRAACELPPKPWALLYDLAAQRDAKNIPAGLGGDLMRAILTGGRYPATLLTAMMGRLRVEGEPDREGRQ